MSAPHEVSRQLSHEPSSSLGDPNDDHRVLEIETTTDLNSVVTLEVDGKAYMYPKYYTKTVSGERIPYPNENVKLHATGYVIVYKTPDGSVWEVNSDKNVYVHGSDSTLTVNANMGVGVIRTGSGPTLAVYSGQDVYVYETGSGSTLRVHSKGGMRLCFQLEVDQQWTCMRPLKSST